MVCKVERECVLRAPSELSAHLLALDLLLDEALVDIHLAKLVLNNADAPLFLLREDVIHERRLARAL